MLTVYVKIYAKNVHYPFSVIFVWPTRGHLTEKQIQFGKMLV